MTFFITNKKQSEMLMVLLDYCDATVIKRNKYKQKMDYYENRLDCVSLVEEAEASNLYTLERYLEYALLCTEYCEHKDKYEALKSRYFSLQTNIYIYIYICYYQIYIKWNFCSILVYYSGIHIKS
jgi:hypothetical protein